MIRFYFIRHGETEYNLQGKVQGWNDSPLTKLGIFQAKCTGYGLRKTVFQCAYSGDALRQIDTARIVMNENEQPIQIITDPHFREMCYGGYEDGTYYEMLNPLYEIKNAEFDGYDGLYRYYSDIEIVRELEKRDETGSFEGMENAWNRLSEGLETICMKHYDGNILISTSSFAICTILYHLFPDFVQPKLVANASITVVSYDGSYHLEDYNNIAYRKAGEEYYSLDR